MTDRDFRNYIRRKWDRLLWRVNNAAGYLKKNITCEFESFHDFYDFCLISGLKWGDHCHRPCRDGPYSRTNLIFVSPLEHNRLTSIEKRKLTDEEVFSIREQRLSGRTFRELSQQFDVSTTTIWNVVKWKSYSDIGHLCTIPTNIMENQNSESSN